MKTCKLLFPILFMMLALSACNAGTATPADEASLDAVYTSVAMTLSAQIPATAQTMAPLSTSTPAPTAALIGERSSTPLQSVGTSSSGNGSSCDNAIYLSDVTIADGTVLTPDESFTKTWSLQNTGTCTWTTSYSIAYYSGSDLSGSTTELTASVSPGGSIEISVDMVAPATAGSYTGYWRLQNAAGTSFGEAVYVQIVVAEGTATVTSTPTATDEDETDSHTSTPTAAPTSTATTAPTNTSAPVASETSSSE